VRSDQLRWVRDSTAPAASQVEQLVGRVLAGIGSLDLTARLGGTLAQPSVSVTSNLDQAIAQRLRAVVGEEVTAAERKVRAQVDSLADGQVAPLRARVTQATSEATARLTEQSRRLDQAQRALEQRLREITRGIRLP
jgi:hypothetical protein